MDNINLDSLIVTKEEEEEIKKQTANAIPIDASIQGWSGGKIRKHLSKSEEAVIGELKKKMFVVKDLFSKVLDKEFTIYSEEEPSVEEVTEGGVWRQTIIIKDKEN